MQLEEGNEFGNVVRVRKADVALISIAGFIVAYDYWAIAKGHETISGAVWRAGSHPKTRWPTVLIVTSLYKHLIFPKVLPKADPLYWVAGHWHENAKKGK